ncbi:MAG TPA: cysteine synthase family protein [Candidatus Dependentiae bacterium]|nr:cysteine synthase family protein [Candidatus Dependentiae bacterium]HRQ62724.1 cysteine synthase family protein [Candidatus Dependentiae bacterium]
MFKNVIDAIGNTPLVKLDFDSPAHIYAKLEYLNPGGSVKDRSASYMISYAEKHGQLKPGGTIIDASSGNQGIATAMIGAAKGYNVIIAVSEKISKEKLDTIKAYGAQVVMCPPTAFVDDPKSYWSTACRLHKETPNSFMPNQYFNPVNAEGHYTLLGPEIWKQTDGKITHFFACAGTGGTVSGAGKYLKEQNPNIKVIALDSNNSYRSTNGCPKPYKVEGMGIDFVSEVMNYDVVDEIVEVKDEDALPMLKTLAKKYGLLAGPSSGAAAWAAQEYAKKLNKNDYAVVIFSDSGRAYLTKDFY